MPEIADFIHSAALRQALTENLESFDDRRIIEDSGPEHPGLTRAAVAVTVFNQGDEASVIVTKRSPRLGAHSGQWAIPGGRLDRGEDTATAALRELREEINLSLDRSDILGYLDDYRTRSGYVITPVVAWSEAEYEELVPNPGEVASIHGFSFTELTRPDSPNLETIPESEKQVLSMNYLNDRIYSPTAAMLYQFREVGILGRRTRVSHYDQPVFAWK